MDIIDIREEIQKIEVPKLESQEREAGRLEMKIEILRLLDKKISKCGMVIAMANGKPVVCGNTIMGKKRFCAMCSPNTGATHGN